MITHQSILDLIASMNVFIKSINIEGGLTELDSFFSFLPLAHIFDR
jgi:long-subunit acyl-CoA synthetase (AMP-forming)